MDSSVLSCVGCESTAADVKVRPLVCDDPLCDLCFKVIEDSVTPQDKVA